MIGSILCAEIAETPLGRGIGRVPPGRDPSKFLGLLSHLRGSAPLEFSVAIDIASSDRYACCQRTMLNALDIQPKIVYNRQREAKTVTHGRRPHSS